MIKKIVLVLLLIVSSSFAFDHLNPDNIESKLKGKNVIVDFYATWCPPCKILGQKLIEFDKVKPKDVTIYKVDIDKNMQLARRYGVKVLPTIVYFKDGKVVKKEVGIKDIPQLQLSSNMYFK